MTKNKKVIMILVAVFLIFSVIGIYLVFLQPKPIELSYDAQVTKLILDDEIWAINGRINGTYYAYIENGTFRYFNGTNWAFISFEDLSTPYVLSLDVYSDSTLYNCEVKVSYRLMNGSWLEKTKNIGIVDFNKKTYVELTGYQLDSNLLISNDYLIEFSDSKPFQTINVEVLGNSQP